MEASFYVGDAAGRPNDHSDCDRALALNAGVRFHTPEAFFLGESTTVPSTLRTYDPRVLDGEGEYLSYMSI